jgi:hypothetical protein
MQVFRPRSLLLALAALLVPAFARAQTPAVTIDDPVPLDNGFPARVQPIVPIGKGAALSRLPRRLQALTRSRLR